MKNTTTGGSGNGSPSNPPPPNPNPPPPTEGSPRRRTGTENAPRGSPQRPPAMGVPGQSAFSPYRRPGGPTGSGSGSGSGAGLHAVPVGGSGPGAAAAPGALRIGGSPAARKRGRDGGSSGGGNQAGDVPRNAVNCSVCGKEFLTPKALFGHMRSHPGRGWKGAHPPPTFRAEEEFADLRAEVAAAEAGEAEAEKEDAEEGGNYRLPDLNNPPPPSPTN